MKQTLTELREAATLTREQLAAASGVSYPTIVRAEGGAKPNIDNAIALAEALSKALGRVVRVEDIAWGTKPEPSAADDAETAPGKDARAAVA